MAQKIPVTNDGNRLITVDPGNGISYQFRTYYSEGMENAWFLDVSDTNGNPLLVGIPIVPGSRNILKGQGDKFRGVELAVVTTKDDVQGGDALGSTLFLMWFNEGEVNPFVDGDPLVNVNAEDFGWRDNAGPNNDHNTLTNRFIPGQHNILAIDGLQDALANKMIIAPGSGGKYFGSGERWILLNDMSIVVYIRNGGTDFDTTAGTLEDPFATPQGALNALAKRVFVFLGSLTLNIGPGQFPGVLNFNYNSPVQARTVILTGAGRDVTTVEGVADGSYDNATELVFQDLTINNNRRYVIPRGFKSINLNNINLVGGSNTYHMAYSSFGSCIVIGGSCKISGMLQRDVFYCIGGTLRLPDIGTTVDISELSSVSGGVISVMQATAFGNIAWINSQPIVLDSNKTYSMSCVLGGCIAFFRGNTSHVVGTGGTVTKDAWSTITGVA